MPHEVIGESAGHRRTLWRMALMYAPLTLLSLALGGVSLNALLGGSGGAAIPLAILAIVTAALAHQAAAALRDLRAEPAFTRGEVARTWTKGGLFWFFRSHYAMVNRQVFVMAPEVWVQLTEGDTIECHHWPHTRTLIRVLLVGREAAAAADPGAPLVPLPGAER